jgi:hypothetical protein
MKGVVKKFNFLKKKLFSNNNYVLSVIKEISDVEPV